MTEFKGCPKPYSCSCSRVAKSCFSRPQRRAESSNCRHGEGQGWVERNRKGGAESKTLGNVSLLPSQETSGVGGEGRTDSLRHKWTFSGFPKHTEP